MIFEIISDNFRPYGNTPNVHLRVLNDPTFRPPIEKCRAPEYIKELAIACWDDQSEKRPSFKAVNEEIRKHTRKDLIIYVRSESASVEEDSEDIPIPTDCLKNVDSIREAIKKYRREYFVDIVVIGKPYNIPIRVDDDCCYLHDDCSVILTENEYLVNELQNMGEFSSHSSTEVKSYHQNPPRTVVDATVKEKESNSCKDPEEEIPKNKNQKSFSDMKNIMVVIPEEHDVDDVYFSEGGGSSEYSTTDSSDDSENDESSDSGFEVLVH